MNASIENYRSLNPRHRKIPLIYQFVVITEQAVVFKLKNTNMGISS